MEKLDIDKFIKTEINKTTQEIIGLKNVIYLIVFIMMIFLVSIILFASDGPNWILWLAIFGLIGFTYKTALNIESQLIYIHQTKNFFEEYEKKRGKNATKSTKKL